jgi:hypothetical protein
LLKQWRLQDKHVYIRCSATTPYFVEESELRRGK